MVLVSFSNGKGFGFRIALANRMALPASMRRMMPLCVFQGVVTAVHRQRDAMRYSATALSRVVADLPWWHVVCTWPSMSGVMMAVLMPASSPEAANWAGE